MAKDKPRSFAAMREDRLLDMAARRFGKAYTSKAAAIRDLSALPIAEQHKLPKRSDPSRKPRPAPYNNVQVLDAMRGGVARAPHPLKLANAVYDKPHQVMRLARASTNIKVTSPTQALALLAKFGSTDMKRSANAAYSELAHQTGGRPPAWPKDAPMAVAYAPPPKPAAAAAAKPRRAATPPQPKGPLKRDLLKQYERYTGVPGSPRATNAWLAQESAAAKSRYNANRVAAGFQVTALATAAVGTYRRKRNEQIAAGGKADDTIDRIKAAGSAAYATAPGLALTSLQGTANHLSHKFISLPFGLSIGNPISGPMALVTKAAGRAVLPALAAWSMHHAAKEDSSALRGAGRGLVRAIDPTSIFMGKGLAERAYDRALGTPEPRPTPGLFERRWSDDPKFKYRNGYERWLDETTTSIRKRVMGGAAYLNTGAARVASQPSTVTRAPFIAEAPAYKNAWTDTRGRTYERRDYSVRKAA